MKQKKIAISLAVVGAIAAPFVFGTYGIKPRGEWMPLTAEKKEKYVAYLKQNNNRPVQKELKEGDRYVPDGPSTPLYLTLNAATAAVVFIVIFGVTYLLPALARRYWRWLNT